MVEQEAAALLGRKPSLADLALLYPVENEYKRAQNRPGTHDYNASKTQWSRLRNGKTAIADGPMTARIERRHSHLSAIRKSPIWLILENPLMPTRKLLKLVAQLEPALGNKLFYPSSSQSGLSYKSLYWTDEHFELAESLDAFTLKLVLYRMRRRGLVGDDWPIPEKDLVLHLFRICMWQPWRSIVDRLVRLFRTFLCANGRGGLTDAEIEYGLQTATTDILYKELFQRVLPEPSSFFARYPTMNHYLQANKILVQNFWTACCPKLKGSAPIASFSSKALYWADKASDVWLTQNSAKEALFTRQPELFDIYYKRVMFFGCRKQIW